jgi:hypothetical protein
VITLRKIKTGKQSFIAALPDECSSAILRFETETAIPITAEAEIAASPHPL